MKLFRENNEVTNNSSIIIERKCEICLSHSTDLKVTKVTENQLCEFLAQRTIKYIDEALKTFKKVEYMTNIDHSNRQFQISVNNFDFSSSSYYSSEKLIIPTKYDLGNIQKKFFEIINKHYTDNGKRIYKIYVTTYLID